MSPRDLISWKPSRTERPERPEKAALPSQRDDSPPASSWMESMDRFVRDFFRDFRLDPSSGSCGETVDWSPPRIALTEHPKEIRLTVHVSGMSAKDIEVKLTGDRLILGGSKENEADDRRQHPKERTYGSFYRSLSLPTGIARDEVRAEIKDGILTLRMPKTEQARKSQRNVEVGQV